MDIGFIWDEHKYRQVSTEHNVGFYEVVSTLDDQQGYEVSDPAGHEGRWMWVGKTVQDRVLVVVYSEEELPLYRIITAFEAEGSWRYAYD